jgi:hypothetical protein
MIESRFKKPTTSNHCCSRKRIADWQVRRKLPAQRKSTGQPKPDPPKPAQLTPEGMEEISS